jgi:hypothetical protein
MYFAVDGTFWKTTSFIEALLFSYSSQAGGTISLGPNPSGPLDANF